MAKRGYKQIATINGVRIYLPVWVAKVKEILIVLGVGITIFALGTIFGVVLRLF